MDAAKGRRGGDICGGERPRRGKILNFPRRGRDGEKKVKIFLAGAGLARKKVKIFLAGACLASPKHTNSRQKYKFLAKIHKNEPIPRHGEKKSKKFPRRGRVGEKKVKIFLAGEGLARKNLVFRPEEFSPYPALSRHTPQKAVSGKKTPGLSPNYNLDGVSSLLLNNSKLGTAVLIIYSAY